MKIILALLFCLSLTSCSIYGLTNDYNKLTPIGKTLIYQLKDFNNLENRKIYKINATQLKEEIKKYDKAMVYIFTNGCSSEKCKPMNVYEAYAEKHQYKLFLVMKGYGHLGETILQEFNQPLFSIDNEYYKAKWQYNYVNRFENDLLDRPLKAKPIPYQGNIFLFEKGKFVKIIEDLPNENQLEIFK